MDKSSSRRALQIRSVISVLTIVVLWEGAAREGSAPAPVNSAPTAAVSSNHATIFMAFLESYRSTDLPLRAAS